MLVERAGTYALTSTNLRGRFSFANVQTFLAAAPSRFTGVLPGAQIERSRRNTTFGFYAQDDVTLHARLTLNLGLRYEFYTVPNETHGRDSSLRNVASDKDFVVGPIFVNPSLKNLGPRLGFAWDVSGTGRTSVRGGWGVYYDTDGPFNTALIGATFSPPFAFPVSILNPTFPVPSFDGKAPDRAARAIDYQVRQPRMLTGHLTLEREVLPNLVVTVGYAASRGYNLVQTIEGIPSFRRYSPTAPSSFRPVRPARTRTGDRSTSGPPAGVRGTTPCKSAPRSVSAAGCSGRPRTPSVR